MTGADDMDGMDRLSIKADRSGIVVYVPAAMSVNDICCDLYCRILDNIRPQGGRERHQLQGVS